MNQRSNFIEYLKHFQTYADEEHKRRLNEPDRKWTPVHIWGETVKSVRAATDSGSMGKLGRVFNEFPVSYALESKTETEVRYSAISHAQFDRWLQAVRELAESGRYDIKPNPLFKDDPELQADPTTYLVTLAEASQEKANNVLEEMIHEATAILLDENGDIHPEVIRLLNMQKIIDDTQGNRLTYDKMAFQLVYSFVSQIMIGGIRVVLDNQFKRESAESGQDQQFGGSQKEKNILVISNALEAKCMAVKDGVAVVNEFFKSRVLDAFFWKSVYSEKSLANYLLHIPTADIAQIVELDFARVPKELSGFLPGTNKEYNDFMAEFAEARMQFWMDIMLHLQSRRELVPLAKILNLMPLSVIERWRKLPNTVDINLEEEQKSLDELDQLQQGDEKKEQDREVKSDDSALSAMQSIDKYFHTRNNVLIIDYIMQTESRNVGASPGKLKVLHELDKGKFNADYVQLPLFQFFSVMFDHSKAQEDFIKLMKKYFPTVASDLTHRVDDPLKLSVDNHLWKNVVGYLLEMSSEHALDQATTEKLLANKVGLTREFLVRQNPLAEEKQLDNVNQLVSKVSKLGEILTTPNQFDFLALLSSGAPRLAAAYYRQSQQEDDLSIGLKVQNWYLVMKGLLARPTKVKLPPHEKAAVLANRETIVEELIKYLNDHYSAPDRIQRLNEVIEGKNALGLMLNKQLSYRIVSWFTGIRDEGGRTITPYIAAVIENRDITQALLNSEVEEKKEEKSPSQNRGERNNLS